jgi:hypothetical protein
MAIEVQILAVMPLKHSAGSPNLTLYEYLPHPIAVLILSPSAVPTHKLENID